MADIRPTDQIAAKWATVTPQRAADYEFGINNPRRDWATATIAASDAYKTGVQAAIAANRFSSGVKAAGTAKWTKGSIEKGLQRWGPGVSLGREAYEAGFAPFAATLTTAGVRPRLAARPARILSGTGAIGQASSAHSRSTIGGATIMPPRPRVSMPLAST